MNTVALHCSSFVGKQRGYSPTNTWAECVQAVSDYYAPPETFAARFEQLILHVQSLGFNDLDVWQPGQLDWNWATEEQIRAARSLLERYRMQVTSYAGEFGETREEFLKACRAATGIGAPLLSGTTALLARDRAFVVATLQECNLQLAVENHPEKTAQEMLDQVGDGGAGRIGTAVDTGWYVTRGYDVVRAIRELNEHILHVHLKNVLPGEEHINCGYANGAVPIEACVRTLKEIGYTGVISVENHNLDHDPDQELKEGGELVRRWLAS